MNFSAENITNLLDNCEITRKDIESLDKTIKETEKMLNEKLFLVEKSIIFNDSDPEIDDFVITSLNRDEFFLKEFNTKWFRNRRFETLSFKKSSSGWRIFYSSKVEKVNLGVCTNLGIKSWYKNISNVDVDCDEIPLAGASVQVKVRAYPHLEKLVQSIITEIKTSLKPENKERFSIFEEFQVLYEPGDEDIPFSHLI